MKQKTLKEALVSFLENQKDEEKIIEIRLAIEEEIKSVCSDNFLNELNKEVLIHIRNLAYLEDTTTNLEYLRSVIFFAITEKKAPNHYTNFIIPGCNDEEYYNFCLTYKSDFIKICETFTLTYEEISVNIGYTLKFTKKISSPN